MCSRELHGNRDDRNAMEAKFVGFPRDGNSGAGLPWNRKTHAGLQQK